MADRSDPVGPEGPNESGTTGSRLDAPPATAEPVRPGPARVDQAGLIERIAVAQGDPPVGLIVVGWERARHRPGAPAPMGPVPVGPGPDDPIPDDDRQVERTVVFAVTSCAARDDHIVASAEAEVAVVRSALGGPAAAEALAHRMATRLDVELDRLAIATGQATARWAIGVAVGRCEDRPADLLRYAETALDDAWVLGGRRIVAFDDGDRELLERPVDPA